MNQSYKPFSLENKVLVVTGASSGIGRECAVQCSRLGAKLVLLGRNEERLQETLSLLDDKQKHTFFTADLTEFDKVKNIVSSIKEKYKAIDGIIHAAGISTTLPFRMLNPKKMDQFLQTNVTAGLNLTRLVLKSKLFSDKQSSIVFISSVMGSVGENSKTLYAMTKGAINAAVKSMAVELAEKNIRVNAVSPGVVQTPMSAGAVYSRNEESLKKIEKKHLLGLGQPEDVAYACIYLLSDAAKWVTGSVMFVDGGYTAR